MKKTINLLSIVGLVAVLATYSSCGPKPTAELPITDQQLQKLLISTSTSGAATGTWKLSTVTLDGVDKTADYTSAFTITLSGTIGALSTATFSYKTTKPVVNLSPWSKDTGTFTFDATNASTTLKRDDGTVITYSANETQFTTSFQFSGSGYDRSAGRTDVVKGQWIFNFIK
jgi:hypothetical protein